MAFQNGDCKFSTVYPLAILCINLMKEGRKEGRNLVLRRFLQLRSYRGEIETWNRQEIPYSSRIVPMGLSVAEGP